MKTEPSNIDKQALGRLLKDAYGLDIATFSFVPHGEESYGYIARTLSGTSCFVKLNEPIPGLDVKYETIHSLYTTWGLTSVVYPHKTRQGKFYAEFEGYTVAIFDFIEGTTSDAQGFTNQDWQQAASITAALHAASQCAPLPPLPVEQFQLWFKDWLHNVLTAAGKPQPGTYQVENAARKLLTGEQADIVATLRKLETLSQHVSTIPYEPVLSHGDLKPENFIKAPDNNLHLIDWSKLAIAPPERDLVNFMGERCALFLSHYVQSWEQAPKLYIELFEYYVYFLKLWAIADYGAWILLEDAGLTDKAHAWQELQQYLPINHQEIQEQLTNLNSIIRKRPDRF